MTFDGIEKRRAQIGERKRELSTKCNEDTARISSLRETSAIKDDEEAKAALLQRDEAWTQHLSTLDRETADRFERKMRTADAILDIRLNGLKELEELRSLSAALSVAKAHLEQQDQLLQETDSEQEALRREIRSETPTEIELPADKPTHAWLTTVSNWVSAGSSAAADVNALVNWTSALQAECAKINSEFGDAALETSKRLREEADAARQAAKVAADALFTDEPLPGVGGETWRALWAAARNYSLSEAYPESEFPVLGNGDEPAACVLCQQPLAEDGRARLQRFQKYMDDTLDATAEKLEVSVTAAVENLMQLACLGAEDFSDRVEQVRKRSDQLADSLSALRTAALKRRDAKLALLNGQQVDGLPDLVIPLEGISAFENEVKAEQTALTQAANSEEREKLSAEKDELEDRKIIAANREKLTTRRNLLVLDAAFEKALSDLQTRGITQRANELVDSHLTKAVIAMNGMTFDLSSPHGRMLATFLSGIAEFESDLISERVKSGLAAAKARGKKLGRQPGERPKSDRLAPKVLKLVDEGRSYRWIARDLCISKNTVLDIVKRNKV